MKSWGVVDLGQGVSPENFLAYLKKKEFGFNHLNLTGEVFVNKIFEVLLNSAEIAP